MCAAPGGWSQIAARTCPKATPIVAVDILPIRALGPQVTTIVGDITAPKCQADIRKALSGVMVDVVLHDGAPNVGADYAKDAYEQNELAIHALKCATNHLKPGGTYCTKVYRSRDYTALQWVLQQLFGSVQALKPNASRSQSAEIFLICQDYKAPRKLDPRFLDPKHVFSEVSSADKEDSVVASIPTPAGGVTVLDANWTKRRRQRSGYDMEHLDFSMRHVSSVQDFILIPSTKTAIKLLSTSTGLAFTCMECKDKNREDKWDPSCPCQSFLHHPFTTTDIKELVSDLQVLNQSDFKRLLQWRTKLQEAWKIRQDAAKDKDDEGDDSDGEVDSVDSEESDNEDEIQEEIAKLRARRQNEKKRTKKKERALAAKRRKKSAMDVMAVDMPDHDKIFSLATLPSKKAVEAVAHANLDSMNDEEIFGLPSDEEENDEVEDDAADDEEARIRRREDELESSYQLYLSNTKDGSAKSGTKMAKRSKKQQMQQLADEAAEDEEAVMAQSTNYSTNVYARMLQGTNDSEGEKDSDDSDADDDGFDTEPMTPKEFADLQKKRKSDAPNPLLHKLSDDEPKSLKTARWFSNSLFESLGKASAETVLRGDTAADVAKGDEPANKQGEKKRKAGLDAEEVLASIPKTDKQVRHEKRLKALARDERRKARRARKADDDQDFKVVPQGEDDESDDDCDDRDLSHLNEERRKKVMEARELIKAGIGQARDEDYSGSVKFAPAIEDRPLPVMDDRQYDEDYDSDDYAQTLALGTMMLRKSKEKALVDASYNRYAWNDPSDLPDWFVDDENKHHRPQLPIPQALIDKMKEKMMIMSTKPIKKVAEARARKNKRAKLKLVAAKKQAEAVVNSGSEMTEAMKLRAISKALRGTQTKNPSKTYVVAKKGRGGATGKGIKQVDKRMKSDKISAARKEKKRKHGKQNKLVGSKKRRGHHK